MIGRILAHLLGNTELEVAESNDVDDCGDLMQFEEGGWVIVKVQESLPAALPEASPLENLLIEHPSMSVYQRHAAEEDHDDELGSDQDEELGSDQDEDSPRSVAVPRHVSWRLAAWGAPLPCHLHLLHLTQRKRLTKTALHRQNLARTRFCPAERRYGHFKQPYQRLYNY